MIKRTIGTIAVMAALALPGTALAEILEYDQPRDESEMVGPGTAGSGCGPIVLGKTITPDEMSANEQIMADAWKSHLHARKAAALEGRG